MLITFLASFLIWIALGVVCFLGLMQRGIDRKTALKAILAFVVATFASRELKVVFGTARPFVLGTSTPLTFSVPLDFAFPSGHTAAAVALAVIVWMHNRRLGIVFLAIAGLIGMSRVWANVHWPIDIAGGAIVGTIVAVVINKLKFRPSRA